MIKITIDRIEIYLKERSTIPETVGALEFFISTTIKSGEAS